MSYFLALDVETANPDFASLCQLGIVLFKDGEVEWAWETLLNPEDYFDPWHVSIHGIHERAVSTAPTFPAVYDHLKNTLGGRVVVCHSAFDRAAIAQAQAKYGLPEITASWIDTARVARRAWPKEFARAGYGLANVAEWCGIDFNHHQAVEDARAAGLVLLKAISHTGIGLEDWFARVSQPIDPRGVSREGHPEGFLSGEVMVFTGALVIPRREAADLAAAAGCAVRANVTGRTTLLVVGQQDLRRLEGHTKSRNHRRAEALRDEGHPIRIVGEDDFLRFVNFE